MSELDALRWTDSGGAEVVAAADYDAVVRERDKARDALREADRILEWWHGTFEPHTRRAWNYDACEPCRPIRDQVRGALPEGRV